VSYTPSLATSQCGTHVVNDVRRARIRRRELSKYLVNTQGASRLTKYYKQPANPALKTQIPERIFKLISSRPGSLCNFLDAPGLSLSLGDNSSNGRGALINGDVWNADDTRIVYRSYATLYFVFVVDGSESELGVLDLIQVR
jgi:AP-3 complex subunit sigma